MGSSVYVDAFHSSQFEPLLINGKVIQYVNSVKNLGMYMDSTLTWPNHCTYVIKKVYGLLVQLRRCFSDMPLHIRRTLVQSLILPHFDYMLPVCTNISKICLNFKEHKMPALGSYAM